MEKGEMRKRSAIIGLALLVAITALGYMWYRRRKEA